jgi:putative endonuclease
MFYVYILYSLSKEKYYVGQTNNIEDRLRRHNSGYSLSTKSGVPWDLIHYFEFLSRSEAVLLEKKIKGQGARRYLISIGFYEQ